MNLAAKRPHPGSLSEGLFACTFALAGSYALLSLIALLSHS